MMIKVNLFAGLGNQLFMILATVSYALDKNIDYSFVSYLDKTTNGTKTYWDTLLDSFKSNVDQNVKKELNQYGNVYNDPKFEYTPLPDFLTEKDYILNGYFQSHKYFENNYDKIKEIMNLQNKIDDVKNENKELFKKKTIGLHFRLGDYLHLQQYHCIKGPEYYIHALKGLESDLKKKGENIEEYDILYFCEKGNDYLVGTFLNIIQDINSINYNFIKVSDAIPDWKQILLMSSCDHFIIANSSFSWFGAYFSNSTEKIVYRPAIWFGPANRSKNISDLCPSNWKKINV